MDSRQITDTALINHLLATLPEDQGPIENWPLKAWAAAYGCSYDHALNLVKERKIPASKIGGKVIVLASPQRVLAMNRL